MIIIQKNCYKKTKSKGQSQVHVICKRRWGTETGDTDYRNYSFPTYTNVKCGALGNDNIQCLCKINYSGLWRTSYY
jgi:hypothetical protein